MSKLRKTEIRLEFLLLQKVRNAINFSFYDFFYPVKVPLHETQLNAINSYYIVQVDIRET